MVHVVIVGDLACAIARPHRKGARANERTNGVRASEMVEERVEESFGATDR